MLHENIIQEGDEVLQTKACGNTKASQQYTVFTIHRSNGDKELAIRKPGEIRNGCTCVSNWIKVGQTATSNMQEDETIGPGDKVMCNVSCCSARAGEAYIVNKNMSIGDRLGDECSCQEKWTKINNSTTNNNTNMLSLIEQFQNSLRQEPEKTFRKAGIVGSDGFLTTDGQKMFLTFLLNKYGAEFKKDTIDPLVAEAEKSKD